MFPLFETIAVENYKPKLLEYHQQRMDSSFLELFHQINPFSLSKLFLELNIKSNGLLKWKVEYSCDGCVSFVTPYFSRPISRVKFVEVNPDFDYSMKFCNRDYFDRLKKDNPGYDELVLLKNGKLTDSTFSNIVLEDHAKGLLCTPSTPLLNGTQRQYLLDNKTIIEFPVSIHQLYEFSRMYFINAMLDISIASYWDIE